MNADIFWFVTSPAMKGNFLGKERQRSEIGLPSQATQLRQGIHSQLCDDRIWTLAYWPTCLNHHYTTISHHKIHLCSKKMLPCLLVKQCLPTFPLHCYNEVHESGTFYIPEHSVKLKTKLRLHHQHIEKWTKSLAPWQLKTRHTKTYYH